MTLKLPALLLLAVGLIVPAYAAGVKKAPTPSRQAATDSRNSQASDAPAAQAAASPASTPLELAMTPEKERVGRQLNDTRLARPLMSPRIAAGLRHVQDFPQQKFRSSEHWGSVLTDIARHLPAHERYQDAYERYMQAGDLVTAGHEWTHFLNEYLSLQAGAGVTALYVLNNRYFTLAIPRGLQGIVPPVPTSLQGQLYDLYLVQNSGNARVDPLYLFDEWTAYANDVTIAVDQLNQGKPLNAAHSNTIQTMTAGNVLEFTFYGFAVGMAVKQYDPTYYAGRQGQKLRDFITWNAQRSLGIYGQALQRQALSRGDSRNVALMRSFRNSADTAAMRAWVKSDLGEDLAIALGVSPKPPAARNVAQAEAERKEQYNTSAIPGY